MTFQIAFRTDSSFTLGAGHLFRCLTLADALRQRGASVFFICVELPGNLNKFIENQGYGVHRLPPQMSGDKGISSSLHPHGSGIDWKIDAKNTLAVLAGMPMLSWLIVDHYALDMRWEGQMRPFTGKIMIIDDLADRPHDCDLLLDQNQYEGLDRRYDGLVPDHCERLLGPRYALLRPEFAAARKTLRHRDGRVRRIFVFFGGSDLSNETAKALEAIRLMNRSDIAVDVVVGASNPKGDQIREICQRMPNTCFHLQVENMAELMALADLAIGAGGTTTWERCFLGLPTLALVLADNQREVAEAMSTAGAMRNVGWHADVTSTGLAEALRMALASPDRLNAMSERSLAIMGGPRAASGVERISDRLKDICADS
jgi:UDP-2,4-diacetamido-2,4,6-trideoxy-beta-L-altropyranose hydrolase